MRTYKLSIFLLLFPFSVLGMEEEVKLPAEVQQHAMTFGDLQSVCAFGQTSDDNNQWFRDFMLCKSSTNVKSMPHLYAALKKEENFDVCTKALAFYAKEYKSTKDENARSMFIDLWYSDGDTRAKGVGAVSVLEKAGHAYDEHIDIYAGGCAAQEMGVLCSMNTPLAQKMKEAVCKHNSCKLKKFLVDKNIVAIKTMLLADNLLFDGNWSGHKYNRPNKYGFEKYDRDTVIECACRLDNLALLNLLVKSCKKNNDCAFDVIKALIRNYNIELLDAFIKKNYKEIAEERFNIWSFAVGEKYLYLRGLSLVPESELKVFEKIVTLLFSEGIDKPDELGRSLLHFAANAPNELAVKFLLERGANPNMLDYSGWSLLYNAYKDPKITSLLLAHGAYVNQQSAYGRTALVSSISHYSWSEESEEVVVLLLKAGADVNAVDYENKSVLHYYAGTPKWANCSGAHAMIPALIQYGAKIDVKDNKGLTPFDCAQANENFDILELLRIPVQKDVLLDEQANNDQSNRNVSSWDFNTTIE